MSEVNSPSIQEWIPAFFSSSLREEMLHCSKTAAPTDTLQMAPQRAELPAGASGLLLEGHLCFTRNRIIELFAR